MLAKVEWAWLVRWLECDQREVFNASGAAHNVHEQQKKFRAARKPSV